MLQNHSLLAHPEISSVNGKADKLVVMLHGLGSDGHDLISLVPYIQPSLPSCHFISPHGIESYDMAPFGRQWFSLQTREEGTIRQLINKNSALTQELIAAKQRELSLTNTETILLGFSQGSMMAMYLALTVDNPYFATIAFSGKLIAPVKTLNTKTPICLIHGEHDMVVEAKETERAARYFADHNIKYDKLIIDNLAHSIDDQGLKFAIKFLQML